MVLSSSQSESAFKSSLTWVLLVVIIVLVAGSGWYMAYRNQNLVVGGTNLSPYSAVALTSNELFFGKITSQNNDQLVLENVYFFTYIPATGTAATTSSSTQNLKPTLIDTSAADALAPTNVYVINKSMIKYSYPLTNDSQVVKTIDAYKKANNK